MRAVVGCLLLSSLGGRDSLGLQMGWVGLAFAGLLSHRLSVDEAKCQWLGGYSRCCCLVSCTVDTNNCDPFVSCLSFIGLDFRVMNTNGPFVSIGDSLSFGEVYNVMVDPADAGCFVSLHRCEAPQALLL